MLLDDSMTLCQTEAGTVTLGREEGGKDMREVLLLDTRPIVFDIHPDQLPFIGSWSLDMEGGLHPGSYSDASRSIHSLEGVLDQV